MTSEALHAATGPRDAWPRGIAFLAVHCEIQELMNADPVHAVLIPVRGFLQAGQLTHVKWEKWLQHPFYWRPLRGGLCGNEEFESASTEARSVSSGWLEIFVHGNLGNLRTTLAGWPTHGRRARSPFFQLQFGPALSARVAVFLTGTRQKRLDVLGIAIFLVNGRRRGRERRRQAPA
jgi:hypothetical protein